MEEMVNKENEWDHTTEASMVEKPIKKVTREEMKIAIKPMKTGKTAGSTKVWVEMISAGREMGRGL